MRKFYAAAAIAAMISSACSTEEPVNQAPASAKLGFRSVITADLTRAMPGDLNDGFKFNLGAAADYAALTAEEVTYAEGSGYAVTNPVTIFAGADRVLTAWAPADVAPEVDDANTFTLTPGVEGVTANAIDFVYQTQQILTSANCDAVSLTMNHAMAKLIFKIEFPVGHTTPKQISELTVKGTPGASKFDIFNNSWATPAAAANIQLVSVDTEITNDFEALVVPMATVSAGDLKITCTVNGQTYPETAITGITKLEKSTSYTVTVTITGTGMVISGVTVGGWITGDNGSVVL